MTLILRLDLDMVKMYLHADYEWLTPVVPKLEPEQTKTHTHTHLTEIITFLHTRMLKIKTRVARIILRTIYFQVFDLHKGKARSMESVILCYFRVL